MNKDFANAIERNSRRHLVVSFEDSNFSDKSLLRLHMADSGEKVNLRVAPKAVDVLMTSLKFDEAVVSDMFKQRPADAMAFLSHINMPVNCIRKHNRPQAFSSYTEFGKIK